MLMPMKNLPIPLLIALIFVNLSACTTAPSSKTYTTVQAGTLQEVKMGTVTAVRQVIIAKEKTDVGTTSGALLGGVAGSEVGQGKGAIAGAIAGAVLGGLAGSVIDKNASNQAGIEVTVKLDSGRLVAITQLADENFNTGDRVRVLTQGSTARVSH